MRSMSVREIKRELTCELCGKQYVVPSLARHCEDKHLEETD